MRLIGFCSDCEPESVPTVRTHWLDRWDQLEQSLHALNELLRVTLVEPMLLPMVDWLERGLDRLERSDRSGQPHQRENRR